MRHRLIFAAETRLGNPAPVILSNEWSGVEAVDNIAKEMLEEAIELWFKEYGGCDFNIHMGPKHIEVAIGVEPAYKLDPLKIVIVNNNIQYSSFTTGIAYGYYGSGIVQTYKRYGEYKNDCKFKRFADKWSPRLQECFGRVSNG